MSDRAEFEKRNLAPEDAIWSEKKQGYYWIKYPTVAHLFNDKWEVWQEAVEYVRAQSVQGAEPVAKIVSGYSGDPDTWNDLEIKPLDLSGCKVNDLLYTQPQPAQQGSVQRGIDVAIDMLEDYASALGNGDLDGAGHSTTQAIYEVIDMLSSPTTPQHLDDAAVDRFAAAMKAKLAKKRGEGRGGWEDGQACPPGMLQQMLLDHLRKGDPVDIGNFAMMIWNRGEAVAGQPAQQGSGDAVAIWNGYGAIEWLGTRLRDEHWGREVKLFAQPTQQGSVPEGWRECLQEMVQAMHDYEMSVDEAAPYKHRAMMDRAHALLSATTPARG